MNEALALAPDGRPYRLLTLRSDAGMVIALMNWGTALFPARIPLSDGSVREALLGCASLERYQNQTTFLGASVGRRANHIVNSRYTFDGETVMLSPSQDVNQLYGSPEGSDKRRWQIVDQNDHQVLFTLSSDGGDQGSPGNLGATVQYRLTDDNRISITYCTTVDKPCPVDMANHIYFSPDGEQFGIHSHRLQILAEGYLPADRGGISHDGLKSVTGTSFDFRNAKVIISEPPADDDQREVEGYGHALLLQIEGDGRKAAAHVWSADERLQPKVYITTPALQPHSGNFLGGTPPRGIESYTDWQGLALESEFLPDSPSHPE